MPTTCQGLSGTALGIMGSFGFALSSVDLRYCLIRSYLTNETCPPNKCFRFQKQLFASSFDDSCTGLLSKGLLCRWHGLIFAEDGFVELNEIFTNADLFIPFRYYDGRVAAIRRRIHFSN